MTEQEIIELCDAYERGLKYGQEDAEMGKDSALHQHNYKNGSDKHIAFLYGYDYKKFSITHAEKLDRLIIKA